MLIFEPPHGFRVGHDWCIFHQSANKGLRLPRLPKKKMPETLKNCLLKQTSFQAL